MDEKWGYPHDLGNLQMNINEWAHNDLMIIAAVAAIYPCWLTISSGIKNYVPNILGTIIISIKGEPVLNQPIQRDNNVLIEGTPFPIAQAQRLGCAQGDLPSPQTGHKKNFPKLFAADFICLLPHSLTQAWYYNVLYLHLVSVQKSDIHSLSCIGSHFFFKADHGWPSHSLWRWVCIPRSTGCGSFGARIDRRFTQFTIFRQCVFFNYSCDDDDYCYYHYHHYYY